jgi:hypothetical protein
MLGPTAYARTLRQAQDDTLFKRPLGTPIKSSKKKEKLRHAEGEPKPAAKEKAAMAENWS